MRHSWLSRVAALALLAGALVVTASPARSSTPDHSTITVAGPAAHWQGPALTGQPELLGPPAPVCSTAAGCDRTSFTLDAPSGFADNNNITVSVTLNWTDPNTNFDVGLFDGTDALLGSIAPAQMGQTLTVSNVNPGALIVEVDGDTAFNADYTGAIFATSVPRTPQMTQPPAPVTFSRETVADPFRLGTEPSVTIGPSGTVYESPILGFETTQSFIDRSDDGGATFNTLGVPGAGKLSPCAEGGDIDVTTDANDTLWYAGLSGGPTIPVGVSPDHGNTILSNCLANSHGANYFADRPWLITDPIHHQELLFFRNGLPLLPDNAIVDSFVGHSYGELIKTAPLPAPGTAAGPAQLNFTSLCQTAIGADDVCFGGVSFAGPPAIDTTSAHAGTSYLPINYGFTDAQGHGHGAVGVAVVDPSANPPAVLRPAAVDRSCVLFPSIAVDRNGNLYEVWDDPGTFQVMFAASTNQGRTWSTPVVLNGAPAAQTAMPAIVAGDDGRVDIAFYGSSNHAPPPANDGPWNVYLLQSLDASGATPHWTQRVATDHPMHVDPVCLSGTACLLGTGPGTDRALGDFFRIAIDRVGRAVISFADGNNRLGDLAAGKRAAEPSFDELVRQASGPSLYASVGDVPAIDVPANGVVVPAHDIHIPFTSPSGPGPGDPALTLTGSSASVTDDAGATNVHIHVNLANLDPVAATLAPAGPVATYLTRWWFNGQVYFAAAELTGGQWSYFVGEAAPVNTVAVIKLASYPNSRPASGTPTTGVGGRIDLIVPATSVGSPTTHDTLFSVTSYALTHALPTPTLSGAPTATTDVPQIADSLPAYNVLSGPSASVPDLPAPWLSIVAIASFGTAVTTLRRRRPRRGR